MSETGKSTTSDTAYTYIQIIIIMIIRRTRYLKTVPYILITRLRARARARANALCLLSSHLLRDAIIILD